MTPIWEPQPAYGLEIPDITKVITQPDIVINEIAFPAVAFAHSQQIASDTWIINHNLNFHPNITVVDSGGTIVEGEIQYVDQNNVVLRFQSAFAGIAYLS
jgi:hypothetical protein